MDRKSGKKVARWKGGLTEKKRRLERKRQNERVRR